MSEQSHSFNNAVACVQSEEGFTVLLNFDESATDEFIIKYVIATVNEQLYPAAFYSILQLRPSALVLVEAVRNELSGPIIPADKANLL